LAGRTASKPDFAEAIAAGHPTDGPAIELGRGVLGMLRKRL
jgi:hypothetical protein